MTSTERARTRRKRRLLVAASVLAATACAHQPPTPLTAVERDVIHLKAVHVKPTVKPKLRATPKPQATKRKASPAKPRIGTAVSIRRLRVTAYCETGSRTYTGTWPAKGTAAVKRSTGIPFGAVLHVAGRGTYVVTDREPERGSSNVDLYFGYRSDCESFASRFGIQHLAVAIEKAA